MSKIMFKILSIFAHFLRVKHLLFYIASYIKANINFIFIYRCNPLSFSHNSKFSTYYNWKSKTYKARKICRLTPNGRKKFVHMTKNKIWILHKNYLSVFNRAVDGTLIKNMNIVISDDRIVDIVYCNNCNY